jgi:uncharacterized protein (DUF697 family)/tellurite resistance protein
VERPIGYDGVSRVIAEPLRFRERLKLGGAGFDRIAPERVDLLGAVLFERVARLCLLVARAGGALEAAERSGIAAHFAEGWGYDPSFIATALPVVEAATQEVSLVEAARALGDEPFQGEDLADAVLGLLHRVAEMDGGRDEAEAAAIAEVARVLGEDRSAIRRWAEEALAAPGRLWARASEALQREAPAPVAPVPVTPVGLPVPTLWLLGKTGAGKSSLIRAMTDLPEAEIGNGFTPCTRTARAFDFPHPDPVMRFLDTRGLGEASYDPSADLAEAEKTSHVTLVLLRLDDPVQGVIAETLRRLRRAKGLHLLIVHTGGDLLDDEAAIARMRRNNQGLMEKAMGRSLPSIALRLGQPETADLTELTTALVDVLPSVVMYLAKAAAGDGEEAEFARHRALVLSYAGSASATGALPFVGGAGVLGVQAAMLAALAKRYGVAWGKAELTALGSALGVGLIAGQAGRLALREAVKLIPGVGTLAGAAAGATSGFAMTWALGRTAGWWFHQQKQGIGVEDEALRARFAEAMKRSKDGAR